MNARPLNTSSATLLVIAKEPVPGRVKTRLTPPFTPQEAAALAEAALTDTLHTMLQVPAGRRVLVIDGTPGPWLPPGFEVVPQACGDLDERSAAAFELCDSGPALLVGMDTPQLTPGLPADVGRDGHDAWFGPAADGGFWGLGSTEAITCVRASSPPASSMTGRPTGRARPRRGTREWLPSR
ncbi:TIGR04282 family arsenosugar biosynthesis glycosyltransferase [Streptomyces ipomoeae]|uniref:TIGR04282 family arsenosugar biosynthesis glycosyltransferase n=1 Tax=Streptomyces ipomoeae TaxID=103232 RepID=UPI001146CB11|nr:DUF2064 domain-containing protein [Streptomyces ipomoeae]MDX2938262.1 DUF2064 domain-containing protein [Streptomyces ipomoeae]TQE21446.1 DUF2064 domain-containing protein [Streptomyces ipomoeae]